MNKKQNYNNNNHINSLANKNKETYQNNQNNMKKQNEIKNKNKKNIFILNF